MSKANIKNNNIYKNVTGYIKSNVLTFDEMKSAVKAELLTDPIKYDDFDEFILKGIDKIDRVKTH